MDTGILGADNRAEERPKRVSMKKAGGSASAGISFYKNHPSVS